MKRACREIPTPIPGAPRTRSAFSSISNYVTGLCLGLNACITASTGSRQTNGTAALQVEVQHFNVNCLPTHSPVHTCWFLAWSLSGVLPVRSASSLSIISPQLIHTEGSSALFTCQRCPSFFPPFRNSPQISDLLMGLSQEIPFVFPYNNLNGIWTGKRDKHLNSVAILNGKH